MIKKKLTLRMFFLVIGMSSIVQAQETTYEREIIVMFRPGVIELPAGITEATLAQVIFTQIDVQNALEMRDTELIIKAFSNFQLSDTLGISRTGEVVRLTNRSNIYKIRFGVGENISHVAADLSTFPSVIYAEPNGIAIPVQLYPNDEHFDDPNYPGQGGYQWNLLNTGQYGGTDDADIDVPEVWDITTGSINTKIGIIDFGVMSSHVDLNGKVLGDVEYYGYHGTHVAGIAAAKTNNTNGIAGVDWNAQIISQNIGYQDDAGIADAVMDAVNAGADIINNSWVLCSNCNNWPPTPRYSSTVRLAFADAYNLGTVSVAAIGNYNSSVFYYPADFGQGIITIGATDRTDSRWVSSSNSGSSYGSHIDAVAPGKDILSTVTYYKSQYNGYYDLKTGTSMAAPHVSGLSGLLLAENNNLYNDDIEQIIRISADDKGALGWDQYYGTGRINTHRALNFINSPYTVNQWSSSSAFIVASTDFELQQFSGVLGIPYGWYWVKQHIVNATVTFPQSFAVAPIVWCRGASTVGFSDDLVDSQTFGLNWSKPIPGTVTSSGATLMTYIYELRRFCLGETEDCPIEGWFPTSVGNVVFAYTALGIHTIPPPDNLQITITGSKPLLSWDPVNVEASILDGYHVYRKIGNNPWERLTDELQNETNFIDNSIRESDKMNGVWISYRATSVISGQESAPSDNVGLWGNQLLVKYKMISDIPKKYDLGRNYPNPFNPLSVINYSLPEKSFVTLKIYNLIGKEIKTILYETEKAGFKNVVWDSKDEYGIPVPSGVYIYKLTAASNESGKSFTKSNKMVLIK